MGSGNSELPNEDDGLTAPDLRPLAVAGAAIAACAIGVMLGASIAPRPGFFLALVCWVSGLVLALWLGTLLFRLALTRRARGRTRFRANGLAALTALATVAVAAAGSQLAVAQIGAAMERMRVSMRIVTPIMVSGSELVFDGYIDHGAAKALRAAAERHPHAARIRLGGEGGELGEATQIRDLIAEKGWDTHASGQCWSGCVIAYLGGRHRTIGPGAQMGFHSASIWPAGDEASERAANERIAAEMIERGVDPAFARKAWRRQPGGMWFAPHDEMIRAGLVHEVADP